MKLKTLVVLPPQVFIYIYFCHVFVSLQDHNNVQSASKVQRATLKNVFLNGLDMHISKTVNNTPVNVSLGDTLHGKWQTGGVGKVLLFINRLY